MQPLPDQLLAEGQAAEYLTVSVSWLQKARRLNIGPDFVRIGRCVRYRRSALDAFVAANTFETAGSSGTTTVHLPRRKTRKPVRP